MRTMCLFINSQFLNIAEKRAKMQQQTYTFLRPESKESLSLSHFVGAKSWPAYRAVPSFCKRILITASQSFSTLGKCIWLEAVLGVAEVEAAQV